jgi:glyoxylase-like metal-dependent hydrolase (beta-lactamase superfamily II)
MHMMNWKVGAVRIIKIAEHEIPIPLDGLLPQAPKDALTRFPWLAPDFMDDDGNARMSIHGLLVDTGSRRILVDTCVGEMRQGVQVPPMPSGFLDRLGEAGYTVEDVDTVVCTHLHFDHVGWNTRPLDDRWVVTFGNARYLFARTEWAHWASHHSDYSNIADTVRPVIEAGAADLVEVDHRICEEVRLVPAPGHTPGHVCVVVESGDDRAVITGDMSHHPVQFALPDLPMPADSDPPTALATRRRFLEDRTGDGALVIGTHFAGRTAGRVRPDGDGWRFDEP